MIVVEPSVALLAYTVPNWGPLSTAGATEVIERCGRVCWKSEGKAGPGTAAGFVGRVVGQFHHESIAEHASATVLFVTDRIVSHQIVRHRIAAYSQESTHYINYAKKGEELSVCAPIGLERGTWQWDAWARAVREAEDAYFKLVNGGVRHYTARYAMPMCLKTELVATYNFRTWLHVLRLRTAPNNTPEIIDLMRKAGAILAGLCPELFGEWEEKERGSVNALPTDV